MRGISGLFPAFFAANMLVFTAYNNEINGNILLPSYIKKQYSFSF